MSIDGAYDTENIFAKILREEMPCVKVYEDENTLAFMDVFPQSRGHMLVIHKHEQARNLLDISSCGLKQIMKSVQKLARAANIALSPDGIIITQFNGGPAGQTVYHFHVHIIPKYHGGLKPHAQMGDNGDGMADRDELNMLATQIKSALITD